MKRKVCVVTGTRADYGLLYWVMKRIQQSEKLELQIAVTGMHLSPQYGNTYGLIEEDGFTIDYKIDMLISSDSKAAIAKSMGIATMGFAQAYEKLNPDMLLVLGDRYEILSAVSAALPMNIPIAHIAGGEITEGAIDDQIRHAITKIAHLHFAGAESYVNNIRNLAEESWRIFNVGDTGIEYINNMKFIDKGILFQELSIDVDKKTILVTLHPTTINSIEREKEECKIFFDIIRTYEEYNIVITYPNSDSNSRIILNELDNLKEYTNIKIMKNLGSQRYLSLMKVSNLVIGNSSSAIVEAPYLKIPVVNYGDRQKGRLMADSIINVVAGNGDRLKEAIDKALGDECFLDKVKNSRSLYGEGNTSENIVKVLEDITIDERLLRKKFIVG